MTSLVRIRGGVSARSRISSVRKGDLAVADVVVGLSVSGAATVDHTGGAETQADDCKRWERSRAMELWRMDSVGGVEIVDGSEAEIVSGVDDHSRYCISAHVVERATARPTRDAIA